MKIVSWNLRCVWNSGDGINAFIHRAGMIYEKIKTEKPDVIAFQEVVKESLEYLTKLFPEYEFFGSFRSADYAYEGLYTAYRKDIFTLLRSVVFWLSPNPYEAGSRFEDQSPYPRLCVMTELRDKQNNEIFRLYNVHLDHEPNTARLLGLTTVFTHIDNRNELMNAPTVLCGDFNSEPHEEVIQFANSRTDFKDFTSQFETTFHDFGRRTACKIDYVFISKDWWGRVEESKLWDDCHEGIYLYDHYPVCVQVQEKNLRN